MVGMVAEFADGAGALVVWQRLTTEVVRRGEAFDVVEDVVLRPDGEREVKAHVVVRPSVAVLALDERDRVLLTRQWAYPHRCTQWRLPGGPVAPADAGPEEAARRELLGRAGVEADGWERVGVVHGADSVTDHAEHLYLATGLRERAEGGGAVWRPAFEHALELVDRGAIPHAGSAHALLAVALRRTRQRGLEVV